MKLENLKKHYSKTEGCVPTADLEFFKITEEFINTVENVVCQGTSTILLTGEHGTGKVLFAKALAFVLDMPCTVVFADKHTVADEIPQQDVVIISDFYALSDDVRMELLNRKTPLLIAEHTATSDFPKSDADFALVVKI